MAKKGVESEVSVNERIHSFLHPSSCTMHSPFFTFFLFHFQPLCSSRFTSPVSLASIAIFGFLGIHTHSRTPHSYLYNISLFLDPPTMLPQAEEKPKPQRKRQRKPPANSKAKKANLAQTPAAPANPPPFQGNQNIQPGVQPAMFAQNLP